MASIIKHKVEFTLDQLVVVREVLTHERDRQVGVMANLHKSKATESSDGVPVEDIGKKIGVLSDAILAL